MRIHRRSINSKELLRVGVEQAKGDDTDITQATVKVALALDEVHPEADVFADAEWDMLDGVPYAVVLVGPGTDIVLADTDEIYIPWVRVDDGSQVIEFRAFEDIVEVY